MPRVPHRVRVAVLGVAFAAGLSLTACGGDDAAPTTYPPVEPDPDARAKWQAKERAARRAVADAERDLAVAEYVARFALTDDAVDAAMKEIRRRKAAVTAARKRLDDVAPPVCPPDEPLCSSDRRRRIP